MDSPAKPSPRQQRHRKQVVCPGCGFKFKSRNRLLKHAFECAKAQPEEAAAQPSSTPPTPRSQEPDKPTGLSRGLSSQLTHAIKSPTTLSKPSTLPKLAPIPPLKLTPMPEFTLASLSAPINESPKHKHKRPDQSPGALDSGQRPDGAPSHSNRAPRSPSPSLGQAPNRVDHSDVGRSRQQPAAAVNDP